MKYLLSLLAILVLAGAGCATTADTTVETDTAVDVETQEEMAPESDQESEETSEGEAEAAVELEAQAEVQIEADAEVSVEAGTDAQVEVEADADISAEQETEIVTQIIEEQNQDEEVVEIILGGGADITVDMEAGNFFFSPSTIRASAGDTVNVQFLKNTGFHTFVIDEIGVKFTVAEGETLSFTAPTEPGSYAYYCDIGSHRALGMEGTLIVQ